MSDKKKATIDDKDLTEIENYYKKVGEKAKEKEEEEKTK